MKKVVYILAAILFLLGAVSLLAGFRVIKIISSAHRLRYELGGMVIVLLAIAGAVLVSVKDLKTKINRVLDYFRFGILDVKKSKQTKPVFVAIYIGLIGIAAFVLMLWLTPYGAGVSPDSTTYIGAAKSILAGKGFSIQGNPITRYPPLYSIFLAITGLFQNNLVLGARFLDAFFFGINMGLFAWVVYLTAGRSFLTTTFAILFFLSSQPLLEIHAWAWSEPLFITFMLACSILLFLYANRPKLPVLIASSLCLGFALITRYIGIAFLPAIVVIVFFSGSNLHFWKRFWNALICLVFTCGPLAVFFVRNLLLTGIATNRSFILHPMPIYQFITAVFRVLTNFIAPITDPVWIRTAIFWLIGVFLLTLIVILSKGHLRNINRRSLEIAIPISCLLFFFCYVVFLYISISSMDASTPIDNRILSPILIVFVVGVFSTIWFISQTLQKSIVLLSFLLIVALFVSMKTPEAFQFAATIQKDGLGYTSRQWQNSESMTFVKKLPEGIKIYTNGADVLGFLTGKQTLNIPNKTDPVNVTINGLYVSEMGSMCNDITEKGAILVYFNEIWWRPYMPNPREITSTCKIPVQKNFEDGILLGNLNK